MHGWPDEGEEMGVKWQWQAGCVQLQPVPARDWATGLGRLFCRFSSCLSSPVMDGWMDRRAAACLSLCLTHLSFFTRKGLVTLTRTCLCMCHITSRHCIGQLQIFVPCLLGFLGDPCSIPNKGIIISKIETPCCTTALPMQFTVLIDAAAGFWISRQPTFYAATN